MLNQWGLLTYVLWNAENKIFDLSWKQPMWIKEKRNFNSNLIFFLYKVILGKNLSRLVEARFSSAHPHEPDTSLWVRGSLLIRRVWHGIHQFGSCKCNAFPFRKLKKIQSYQMKGSRHISILSWFCFANALWLISPVRFASCSPTNQMQKNTRLGHIRFP